MNPHRLIKAIILSAAAGQSIAFTPTPNAFTPSTRLMAESPSKRRSFLNNIGIIAAGTFMPTMSNALDFDAFEKGLVESDTKNCNPKTDPKCIPKLTPDEALCQYGKSGQARGEACQRVKNAGGKLPEVTKVKSLGGAYAM
jgi:hypothetical protein